MSRAGERHELDAGEVGLELESESIPLREQLARIQTEKSNARKELERLQEKLRELVADEQALITKLSGEDEPERTKEYERDEDESNDMQADLTEVEKAALRLARRKEQERLVQEALQQQVRDVKEGNVPERPGGVKLAFLEKNDPRRQRSERIALASYPRSGNSLLRSLVERLTGIYTGSDADPRRPLNIQLVERGMKGEGMVEDLVFAVKTHFPERLGWRPFEAGKAIVVARNPFDAIVSYFNMVLTETHTDTIEEEEFIKYGKVWDAFIREEVEVWKQFHLHWLNKAVVDRVPVLFIRYEDMLEHRRETYERIAAFVLNLTSLENTPYEAIVEEASGTCHTLLGVYRPRSAGELSNNSEQKDSNHQSQGDDDDDATKEEAKWKAFRTPEIDLGYSFPPLSSSVLRNLRFYTKDQIKYVLYSAKSELCSLGYWESFFASEYGPAQPNKRLNSCLVLKETKAGGVACIGLNKRYGLRPLTKDDPFGRGFGKRWRSHLKALPPVRIKALAKHKAPST